MTIWIYICVQKVTILLMLIGQLENSFDTPAGGFNGLSSPFDATSNVETF